MSTIIDEVVRVTSKDLEIYDSIWLYDRPLLSRKKRLKRDRRRRKKRQRQDAILAAVMHEASKKSSPFFALLGLATGRLGSVLNVGSTGKTDCLARHLTRDPHYGIVTL